MNEEIEAVLAAKEPGTAVIAALRAFLANDAHLLNVDANERSITHILAQHLSAQYSSLDVDCEYNRDGVDPKRLRHMNLHPNEEDTDARTVFPDIIVHRRGSDQNYLVIEVKKSTNPDDRDTDFAKLAGYKNQLGYSFALYLEFATYRQAAVIRAEWV